MEMVYDVMAGKFGSFYVNPGDKLNGLDSNDSASLTPFNTKYHEDIPVMQFTGLKDKNGVEIYEGDIVKVGNKIMSVLFKEGRWCTLYESSHYRLYGWVFNEIEIIGNIHQHPELLK